MFKAFKYRIEPNVSQERELEAALETHRRLYNECLGLRKSFYETTKKSVKYTEQSAWFKAERATNAWYAKLNFSSAQATLRRLDKSFQNFFRRLKAKETPGYPRFKARDRFSSWTYPTLGDGCQIKNGKLYLQNIGLVRVNWHREYDGTIKTVTILKEGGKWYVSFACEMSAAETTPSANPEVGVDVGLESFLTASDGLVIENPKLLKAEQKKLRREQRALSRKVKGSKSRRKQRSTVAKIHAKVANARKDFHHKTANDLVTRYGVIAVENLNIKGMLKNHRLARAISDAAWGGFLITLKHKAESAGVQVVEVNARGTSQECSCCGEVVQKKLSCRQHVCPFCGYTAHRDLNAARNILARSKLAGTQPGLAKVLVGEPSTRSRLL